MGKRNKKNTGSRQPANVAVSERSFSAVSSSGRHRWLMATAVAVSVGVAGFLAYLWWDLGRPVEKLAEPANAPVSTGPAAIATRVIGPADACKRSPSFVSDLGFEGTPVLGTSLKGYTGLTVSELAPDGGIRHVYQHPTWDDAGSLGAYVYTAAGDVFVSPAPLVSLLVNPPALQNRIYRVDSRTGEMAIYAELPSAAEATSSNPFGVLGLAYDCATASLYASSVAGSTFDRQAGHIYRVDLNTGEATSVLADLDTFGLGVFNGVHGKRLYFGAARDSGVYSVPLDASGKVAGEIRREFYLAELEGGGNEKAKRIRFSDSGQMNIRAYDFNYTLTAASDHRQRVYELVYDPETDGWNLESVNLETVPFVF